MEHGPLPPHERTWRHPSELAAEEHAAARAETTGATSRIFAFTTGTLGLLAVGLLMVAVTPSRSTAPVAISATTTPTPSDAVSALATASTASSDPAPIGLRGSPEPLATPIGDGRYALITAADLTSVAGTPDVGEAVAVAVPSGRLHDARVVGRAGETVLVELEGTEPAVAVAARRPAGHEVVTVLAEPPVTIVLDDLAELDVEEGTAVLDDDGDLVGLCSQDRHDETRLVAVDDAALRETSSGADRGSVSDVPVGATSGG